MGTCSGSMEQESEVKQMKNLKSCPFCGGEARLIQKSHGSQSSPTRITNSYVVGCDKCRIYTEYHQSDIWQGADGVVNIDANGAIDAIEAWNRRVGEENE